MSRVAALVLTTCLAVLAAGRAVAISPGSVDTFSTGLDAWQKGQVNPTYLSTVSSGGPAGAGDAYMRSVADGGGSFGRLTVFNQGQWNANYATAGVTSIRMDLLNSGSSPLQIRIGLRDAGGDGFVSTTPFLLGVGAGWQTADFPVTQAGLTAVGTPAGFGTFLSNGFALRILHATDTGSLNGDTVVGTLGVDNVTALPEPSMAPLVVCGGGLAVAALVRRLKRSHGT